MRTIRVIAGSLLALLAALGPALLGAVAAAGSVPRAADSPAGSRRAVFVQTNDPTGNTILAFTIKTDGTLSRAGSYETGGLGGSAVKAPADPLASQGSLTYDPLDRMLFAVNAGSDTFTVFSVRGAVLERTQILDSMGSFPVSIAVGHGRLYVLNGGGDGSVSAFRIHDGIVVPIPESTRSLMLGNSDPPYFLASPGQVALSPNARQLVVTTKGNGLIDVFSVDDGGRPSAHPVLNPSAGPVPFGAVFDAEGHLVVAEASAVGSASSYDLHKDGSLGIISDAVANGQAATCWNLFVRGFMYAMNTGSATISGYADDDGRLSLLDSSGVTAKTRLGPIDAASSGRYLYVQEALNGTIGEFRVRSNGSVVRIGTVTGLPVFNGNGMEGIAAT